MKTIQTACVLLTALLAALSLGACSASRANEEEHLTLLSYNVQNLFDGVYDGTEYHAFDPRDGVWDEAAAEAKAERIARVVREAVDGGPDVLCLQEVENARIVSLLASEFLSGLGYRHAAVTEAVGPAVQVAVLSRHRVRDARVHAVAAGGERGGGEQPFSASRLRPVLETHLDIDGASLHVFSNHWKSKSGGAAATEPARRAAAGVIARRIGAIEADDPRADIVVCGDLNEEPAEYHLADGAYPTALMPAELLGAVEDDGLSLYLSTDPTVVSEAAGAAVDGTAAAGAAAGGADAAATQTAGADAAAPVLYSPWSEKHAPGSYFFRSRWRRLDHTLVSGALFDARGFSFSSFTVVRPAFAVTADGRPKPSPRPGAEGWDTAPGEGYSDHFPVLLTLERESR
ncbi:MAG: endonuclease/exonuclease/phosphatase family protein [Spirochaetota bacterium]